MRILGLAVAILMVAGCSTDGPTVPRPQHTASDSTVLVDGADSLVEETLTHYVELSNEILSGRRPPSDIGAVSTPQWAVEEIAGFDAVVALDTDAPRVEMSRWQVSTLRGRHTLVDALVAACLGGDGSFTRVTIHLVPRQSQLVIAQIVPTEDSTWCLA